MRISAPSATLLTQSGPRHLQRVLLAIASGATCSKCEGSGDFVYPSTAMGTGGMGGSMMTRGACPGSKSSPLDSDCEIYRHMLKRRIKAPQPLWSTHNPKSRIVATGTQNILCYVQERFGGRTVWALHSKETDSEWLRLEEYWEKFRDPNLSMMQVYVLACATSETCFDLSEAPTNDT